MLKVKQILFNLKTLISIVGELYKK